MCDFVLLGLPQTRLDMFQALMPPGLEFWPCGNPALRQVVPTSCAIFWVVAPKCSCGIWPGDSVASPPPALGGQYKRSGGSRGRPKRAAALANINQYPESSARELFLGWVHALLESTGGPLYLHVAMYSGSQEGETPPIAAEVGITVESGEALQLPRETLVRLILCGRPNNALQRTRFARR